MTEAEYVMPDLSERFGLERSCSTAGLDSVVKGDYTNNLFMDLTHSLQRRLYVNRLAPNLEEAFEIIEAVVLFFQGFSPYL